MKPVTVYTTDACSHCRTAEDFLTQRSIPFDAINLARDTEGREKLIKITGRMSFPQIVINDLPIGGLAELVQAEQDGTLEKLLPDG